MKSYPFENRDPVLKSFFLSFLYPAVILLMTACTGILGSSFFNAQQRLEMIGKMETFDADTEILKPLSLDHIRVVAGEQAAWKGDKVIAEAGESYGSKFHPGKYNAQKIGDELHWVSFLEYNAFRHWSDSDGTPGYITVSAENIEETGHLKTKTPDNKSLNLRFVDSAYFGDYLRRKIYQEYKTYTIADIHREIDDEYSPWYIVTLTRPISYYLSLIHI